MGKQLTIWLVAACGLMMMVDVGETTATGMCSCYQMRVKSLKKCVKTPLILLTALNFTIDNDCRLIPHGCINYGAFSEANVTFTTLMPSVDGTTTSKFDACKMADTIFGATTSCPVNHTGEICSSLVQSSFNLANLPMFLDFLDMSSDLGELNGTLKVLHNANLSSCYKFSLEVLKMCDPSLTTPPAPPLSASLFTLSTTTALHSNTSTATNLWSSVVSNLSSLAANITTTTMTPLPTVSIG